MNIFKRYLPIVLIPVIGLFFLAAKKTDFQVLHATKQTWHGGHPGSGGGINYSFTLVAGKGSDKLAVDQLWVGDKYLEINQVIFMGAKAGEFSKNDTIHFKAGAKTESLAEKLAKEHGKVKEAPPGPPLPYEYKGEALIGYTVGGKRKYIEIEKLENLKNQNYP